MNKVMRGGVIGAGVFGGYHARQYAQAEGARLAAVFDPDLERAREVAARHEAAAFDASRDGDGCSGDLCNQMGSHWLRLL
jgi:predicted dehydrogenase